VIDDCVGSKRNSEEVFTEKRGSMISLTRMVMNLDEENVTNKDKSIKSETRRVSHISIDAEKGLEYNSSEEEDSDEDEFKSINVKYDSSGSKIAVNKVKDVTYGIQFNKKRRLSSKRFSKRFSSRGNSYRVTSSKNSTITLNKKFAKLSSIDIKYENDNIYDNSMNPTAETSNNRLSIGMDYLIVHPSEESVLAETEGTYVNEEEEEEEEREKFTEDRMRKSFRVSFREALTEYKEEEKLSELVLTEFDDEKTFDEVITHTIEQLNEEKKEQGCVYDI